MSSFLEWFVINEIRLSDDSDILNDLKAKGFDYNKFIQDEIAKNTSPDIIKMKLKAKRDFLYSTEKFKGDPKVSGQMPDSIEQLQNIKNYRL